MLILQHRLYRPAAAYSTALRMMHEANHENRRRQAYRLFDAADQPVVSAGALSRLQPGIFRHHLPDRSGSARRRGAGAARSHRAGRQIRVHSHARFDRFRRLHRNRTGDPGPPARRGGRLHPRDVSRRRRADRGRPRALGVSQEARHAEDRGRKRRLGRHLALWFRAVRLRHHGLQAPLRRSRHRAEELAGAELHPEDHSACRRLSTDLRTGALSPRGHYAEGGVDRPRRARPVSPRARRRRTPTGARGALGAAFQGGFDAGPWDGCVRLYGEIGAVIPERARREPAMTNLALTVIPREGGASSTPGFFLNFVMPGLVPAIHVSATRRKTWMPATSAGMTMVRAPGSL